MCGGTPCQAFSLAGWKKGLNDDRGNLTLRFVDIINANDDVRLADQRDRTIVLWENVEGVLRDKTNAFGCFLASLAGYDEELKPGIKWPSSGLVRGPIRNIAWRLIDAKYFGLPQQRKRLYVIAGGKEFNPEDVLFEVGHVEQPVPARSTALQFIKDGVSIEVFRSYTDCLYSAYGTKWNGNAAAYNGSLFVSQGGRLRRLTPLECERLMGFPDHYTTLPGAKTTARYQAVGNSWAVPVVKWLGHRIADSLGGDAESVFEHLPKSLCSTQGSVANTWTLGKELTRLADGRYLNGTTSICNPIYGDIKSVIDVSADESLYLTPVGCNGILRRKEERGLTMNTRLEAVLHKISGTWSVEDIEAVSRRQTRGKFSSLPSHVESESKRPFDSSLWNE